MPGAERSLAVTSSTGRGRPADRRAEVRSSSADSSNSSSSSDSDHSESGDGPFGLGVFAGLFGSDRSSPSNSSPDVADEKEEAATSQATSNLEGFCEYFQDLKTNGVRLTEATYIVNKWALGGIIPMTHHGFCFKTSAGDYFSLDFSRQGIVWDTYGDETPGLPDNTFLVQTYQVDIDPLTVKSYCDNTKPFAWLSNDCDTWSQGLLLTLGITQKGAEGRRSCRV